MWSCLHQSRFYRETEPTKSMCAGGGGQRRGRKGSSYFEELVCMVLGAGQSEMCRVSPRAGSSGNGQYYSLEFEVGRASQQAGESGRISMLLSFEVEFYLGNLSLFSEGLPLIGQGPAQLGSVSEAPSSPLIGSVHHI